MANVQKDLIFDVGMHKGYDTSFYLAKGFRVVAIEANPVLVEIAREKFAEELNEGRLTIIEKAISHTPGEIPFFVFDEKSDWGTIDSRMVNRNEERGVASRSITVEAVTFDSVLKDHGIPYFLKVDIEGADTHCIRALQEFDGPPPSFVSIEANMEKQNNSFEDLDCLSKAGYTHFQIMNMDLVHLQSCPFPAREGAYIEHDFGPQTSGLFGNELPGAWITLQEAEREYRRLSRELSLLSMGSKLRNTIFSKIYFKLFRNLGRNHVGWYDIHATTQQV